MTFVQFADEDRSRLETEVCNALQDLQFPCQLRENNIWTENVIHSLSSKESLQLAKDLLMHLRVNDTNFGDEIGHTEKESQSNEVSSLAEITSWNDFLTCAELSRSMPVSSWMLTPLRSTEAIRGQHKQVMIRLEVIFFSCVGIAATTYIKPDNISVECVTNTCDCCRFNTSMFEPWGYWGSSCHIFR